MTLFRHKRILQSGGILLVLVLFLFTGLASVPKAYAESVTVSGVNFNATAGIPFSGTVATVSDPAATDPSQLTAQINWGDGTLTPGAVSGSGGSFTVAGTGSHTYTSAGTFTFTVSVTDISTGLTASGSGQASVHSVQDVTAPALSLPGTITKDATSPQGVMVTYTVTATDPDNPASQLTISCSPVSGSTFPIGTTTVNCTASDPAGNTASGSFQVVVVALDTTAPTLNLPSTITVSATSPAGAIVIYTVTASDPDNTSAQLMITCLPASGRTFAIGTTIVQCSASDPANNMTKGSFSVVVNGAGAQVTSLISLVNSDHLKKSLQTALDNKLKDVQTALKAGQTATACSELTDFIGMVQSQISKGITTTQATQLIAAARRVQATLGC
jgi:HYR domain-containing protein/FIMAH domain-containing protein